MKKKAKQNKAKKTFRKINILFHIVLEQPFFPKVNFFSNSM